MYIKKYMSDSHFMGRIRLTLRFYKSNMELRMYTEYLIQNSNFKSF